MDTPEGTYISAGEKSVKTKAAIRKLQEAWYDPDGGFYLLRNGVLDDNRLNEIVGVLQQVDVGGDVVVDRQFVSLTWLIPSFIEWQRDRVPQDRETLSKLDRIASQMQNQIERILGTPLALQSDHSQTLSLDTSTVGYVDYSEVQSLLQGGRLVMRPDLEYNEWQVYSLGTTRILVVNTDGSGTLYPTFSYLFVDVASFIENIESVLTGVPEILRVPSTRLDLSVESLSLLDKAVRERGGEPFLERDVFGPIVAYVGEVIRGLTGGTWGAQYIKSSDHDFDVGWIPSIIVEHRHIPFVVLLRNVLVEWEYWSSIQQQIAIRWG